LNCVPLPTIASYTLDPLISPSSLADFLRALRLCKIRSVNDAFLKLEKLSSKYVLADCDLAPMEYA